MEILQYIAELVQSQREIGIAGLGTIYKKKSPGRYDAATHSFLPPSYTLAFKDEITDAETLSNRLSFAENLNKEEANEAIAEFVEDVRKQLSTYGIANFTPLGTLKAENGSIQLEVEQDFNPGPDFFGLPKIENAASIPEVPEYTEPEQINQPEEVNPITEVSEPVVEAPIEVLEPEVAEPEAVEPEAITESLTEVPEETLVPEPEIITPAPEVQVNPVEEEIIIDSLLEEENPGNETHEPQLIEVQQAPLENSIKYTIHEQAPPEKAKNSAVVIALAIVALVMLSAIFYLLRSNSGEPAKKAAVVTVDSTKLRRDSLQRLAAAKATQDSLSTQDSVAKALPATAAVAQTAAPDTIKKVAADTATTYEIIGASVLNQKEADWFITQMKRNGIKAKVVRNIPGKRLKMSIATVGDEKTAKAERDRLEKKLDIKGIYIYRNKKE